MIYLDWHALAPVCPEAAEAALSALSLANPASVHRPGRQAAACLETARHQVADSLGVNDTEIVLTSGGTESCILGLVGLALGAGVDTVWLSAMEHPALHEAAAYLAERGLSVRQLAVSRRGVSAAAVQSALDETPRSVMCMQWVNHETGHIQPVETVGALCAAAGASLFVDGVQALGKIPAVSALPGVSALAISGAKIGAPSGAGALWISRDAAYRELWPGATQERGRRPGSPSLAPIAAMGAALSRLDRWTAAAQHLAELRAYLAAEVTKLGGVLNSSADSVPTVVNVSFEGLRSDLLVTALDLENVAISSGAACAAGSLRRSPVIAALYPDEVWRADSALRFSFGPGTTHSELASAVDKLRLVLSRAGKS